MEDKRMTKPSILGFGRRRFVFVVAAMPVLILSGVLTRQPWYETLLALYSVVTLMYLAEGKRAGAACGILFCLGNGALFLSRGVWGLAVFNGLIAAPVYLFSLIAWGRNQNKQNHTVQVKQLTGKQWPLVAGAGAVIFTGLLFLLEHAGSNNPVFDALTLALFMPALVLLLLRYVENWILHLAGNFSAMAIWIISTIDDPMNFNFVVISAVAAAVNVIGLATWLKLKQGAKET